MPPVSEKQRRAMYAAAAGHSKIGIPQKVGIEFVGKVSAKPSKSKLHHKAAAKGFRQRTKAGYE